jgi:hypothetical protein
VKGPSARTLRAVINPEAFPACRGLADGPSFARAWRDNRPWVLANLAHAAYHGDETIGRLMGALGAQATEIFQTGGAKAFLSVWPDRAVLSFRGTQPNVTRPLPPGRLREINLLLESRLGVDLPGEYRSFLAHGLLADLKFRRAEEGAARVHRGFLQELDKLWPLGLQTRLEALEVPVWATGHSLGGAMATIAGLRHRFTDVVTFGEPRAGRRVAAGFQAEGHTRYVHGQDLVPSLPPDWWPFNYQHHGSEIAIVAPNGPDPLTDHAIVYYAETLAASAGLPG